VARNSNEGRALLKVSALGDPFWSFAISAGLAFSMLLLAPILSRLPSQLRHSWFFGGYAIVFCYVLVALPFLLMGHYDVAVWALLAATLWLATVGNRYVRMIKSDMARHVRDGRGPTKHSHECPETLHLKLADIVAKTSSRECVNE